MEMSLNDDYLWMIKSWKRKTSTVTNIVNEEILKIRLSMHMTSLTGTNDNVYRWLCRGLPQLQVSINSALTLQSYI